MDKSYHYDKKSDILCIHVKQGEEERFEEIIPGINSELDENDDIIGVEILKASRFTDGIKKRIEVKG